MMKKYLHKSTEKLLSLLPFSLMQKLAKIKLTIPFYHIVNDDINPLISNLYKYRNVQQFEKDLDFFQKNYNIINLNTLLKHHEKGHELPQNALLLTFDDGMREMIDVVLPILIRRKLKAVFFITTDFVDNKNMFFRNKVSLLISHVKKNESLINFKVIEALFVNNNVQYKDIYQSLHELKFEHSHLIDEIAETLELDFQEYMKEYKPYLTSKELAEMKRKGFSLGSHSVNHRKYGDTTEAEQLTQTLDSTKLIRNMFNLDFGVFAFPFNDQKLSCNFFNEIEESEIIDLVFSADGFYEDECPINYHRFWMESTNETAKQILLRNFKEKFFRKLKVKNKIVR